MFGKKKGGTEFSLSTVGVFILMAVVVFVLISFFQNANKTTNPIIDTGKQSIQVINDSLGANGPLGSSGNTGATGSEGKPATDKFWAAIDNKQMTEADVKLVQSMIKQEYNDALPADKKAKIENYYLATLKNDKLSDGTRISSLYFLSDTFKSGKIPTEDVLGIMDLTLKYPKEYNPFNRVEPEKALFPSVFVEYYKGMFSERGFTKSTDALFDENFKGKDPASEDYYKKAYTFSIYSRHVLNLLLIHPSENIHLLPDDATVRRLAYDVPDAFKILNTLMRIDTSKNPKLKAVTDGVTAYCNTLNAEFAKLPDPASTAGSTDGYKSYYASFADAKQQCSRVVFK